jgi:hypothetical protein
MPQPSGGDLADSYGHRAGTPPRKSFPFQKEMKMRTRTLSTSCLAMLLAFGAASYPAAAGAAGGLSAEEQADLLFMREEEKLARDTYLTFYDAWDLQPFANIASSEQMHMDAILTLLNEYGLADPAANTAMGEFANADLQTLHDTLTAEGGKSGLAALKVGGIIEETDMRDIQGAIARSRRGDVDAVYENLLCGSRNHLRAFARNIEALTGQSYVAQVLEQAEVDRILDSPQERCGMRRSSATRR